MNAVRYGGIMKSLKKIIALALVAVLALSFAACGKEEKTTLDRELKVYTLMGPTGIGMSKLINDSKNAPDSLKLKYDFNIASAPDQISAEVIKGNYDIAAVPVNLASVLYKKTGGELYVAGVNTLGVLYILENGNTINSVADLKGKTLYATGKGSNPEYVLNYILTKNGIDPEKDITIEYVAEHSELATKMSAGDVVLGMLPEPNVTAAMVGNKDIRIALDLTAEWKKVADADMVQGCIIINKKFADENPGVVKEFLTEYAASVDFVNKNIDDAAAMCEAAGIIPKAAVAKKAIPNCNIVMIKGDDMKNMVRGMLDVLFNANPASVGGEMPADSFYLIVK